MSGLRRWSLADSVDPFLMLIASVEEIEQAGQRQLLASDVIPARMCGCTDDDLAALGFELGGVADGDPLFRYARLPEGWTRRPEQTNARGSYLVDEHGRDRASIFYKAAPYGRSASMTLYPVASKQAAADD